MCPQSRISNVMHMLISHFLSLFLKILKQNLLGTFQFKVVILKSDYLIF